MTEWRTVRRNGRKVRIPVTTAGNGHLNIQKSIRHPGRVREYVRREYGDEAFTERGTKVLCIIRQGSSSEMRAASDVFSRFFKK